MRDLEDLRYSLVRQREADGRQVYEELSFNPIRDLQDRVIGVNCFMRDITESQEYLHKIEQQNKRLRRSAGSSPTASVRR